MRTPVRIAMVVIALLLFSVVNHSSPGLKKRSKNGPYRVRFESFSKEGPWGIEPLELASLGLPPLPPSYAALDNQAFRITTGTVTSGLHSIQFVVPSVKEEREFRNVRILQFGNDSVWRDVTVLDFDKGAPLFPARSVLSQSQSFGVYVIAKLVGGKTPETTTADLVVSIDAETDRLTAPRPIRYTIKVLNRGPNDATDVALWDELARYANLISAEPSQGKCRDILEYIDCKLGSLKVGEWITLAVRLEPFEGMHSFPKGGQKISHVAGASAAEKDPKPKNNEASDKVLVFPNPNRGPVVTLNSPKEGARFVEPADITLEATAYDTDGSISKVEFFEFDNKKPLGVGTSVDGQNFGFTARGVSQGRHLFLAVATDNGGREAWSAAVSVVVTRSSPQ